MVKTYIEQLIPISFKTTVFSPNRKCSNKEKKKKKRLTPYLLKEEKDNSICQLNIH